MPRLYFGDWSATEWFTARRFVGGAVIGLVLAAVPPQARTEDLALVGATIVDVGHFGTSEHDLANAVVVLRGGRITAVGPRASVAIPEGARVIDLAGRYLVPGLIDGFAAQPGPGQGAPCDGRHDDHRHV